MSDIRILKMMVHEYSANHGTLPNNMADLRVNAEKMVSRKIRKISIGNDGVISALLTKKLGNDAKIELIPESYDDGYKLDWTCISNLPSYVLTGFACESTSETDSQSAELP